MKKINALLVKLRVPQIDPGNITPEQQASLDRALYAVAVATECAQCDLDVLCKLYGLHGFQTRTMRVCAGEYAVTQETIARRRDRITGLMRKELYTHRHLMNILCNKSHDLALSYIKYLQTRLAHAHVEVAHFENISRTRVEHIDQLNLPVHVRNALLAEQVLTVPKLRAMSNQEILALPRIGPDSLSVIKEKLTAYAEAQYKQP